MERGSSNGSRPCGRARPAAVMDGLQLQWVLDPQGFDMVGRFRQYADRLLRSVTAAGTGLPADA
ncbi:hypothetical protein ADK57_08775 [Streptomyces sp. MMG1533]|uniref:hypothetical protein n=1 Tax=Streptomyces sp. MMG1533 TaxID=1415546 RepID=UPI0006AFEFEE|nr:hypothetical protein [Streptomyces sp. MMG1533]KOU73330.1 hypothetical protein ADK57_08775 [Streptomyces sp. MMG1533]